MHDTQAKTLMPLDVVEEIFRVFIKAGEEPSSMMRRTLGELLGKSPNEVLKLYFYAASHPGERLNGGVG